MPSWAQALIRLATALLAWWQERKTSTRVDAVRADSGSAWLHKFGGTDKRTGDAASDSKDSGSGDHQ